MHHQRLWPSRGRPDFTSRASSPGRHFVDLDVEEEEVSTSSHCTIWISINPSALHWSILIDSEALFACNSPEIIFCPISTNKISLDEVLQISKRRLFVCENQSTDDLVRELSKAADELRSADVDHSRSTIFRLTRLSAPRAALPICHGSSVLLDCLRILKIDKEQHCQVMKTVNELHSCSTDEEWPLFAPKEHQTWLLLARGTHFAPFHELLRCFLHPIHNEHTSRFLLICLSFLKGQLLRMTCKCVNAKLLCTSVERQRVK